MGARSAIPCAPRASAPGQSGTCRICSVTITAGPAPRTCVPRPGPGSHATRRSGPRSRSRQGSYGLRPARRAAGRHPVCGRHRSPELRQRQSAHRDQRHQGRDAAGRLWPDPEPGRAAEPGGRNNERRRSAHPVLRRGGATTNGNKVGIYNCNGRTGQQWTIEANGTIELGGSFLDIKGAGTTNGSLIVRSRSGRSGWVRPAMRPACWGPTPRPGADLCLDGGG